MKIQSKIELADKETAIKEYMEGYMRKYYPTRVYRIEFANQVIIEETKFLESSRKDKGPKPSNSSTHFTNQIDMDKITKNSIKEQVALQMNQKGLSQNRFAKLLGISSAQLSNILTGNWDKISDGMWNSVRSKLGGDSKQGWLILTTQNFASVEAVCDDAKDNQRMLGIIGPTGLGKTKALQSYAQSNPNTGYVLCDFLMTQKSLMVAVAKAFGLDSNGTKQVLMNRVCERMNKMDKPLLILDDLGKVNDRIYRIIQLFYDRTEGNAGIVVAGVQSLRNYLEKCAHRDKVGFRELLSRIEYWQELRGPARSEVKGLCNMYGIEDGDVVRFITRVSDNFRILRSLITNARRAAGEEGITLDLVESIKINRAS